MGYIPLASGALTGLIAKGVGGKLDNVFGVDDGLTLGKRVAAGATTEIGQEVPQSYMEQVAQNYAEQAWDPSRPLTEGALNAAIQGGVLAGPMGGGFAGAFGSRPRGLEPQTNPVAGDIERAIRETTGEKQAPPQQQAIPEAPAGTDGMRADSRSGFGGVAEILADLEATGRQATPEEAAMLRTAGVEQPWNPAAAKELAGGDRSSRCRTLGYWTFAGLDIGH